MMLYILFIGDLLVMAGIIGIGVWLFIRQEESVFDVTARIPLADDMVPGEDSDNE